MDRRVRWLVWWLALGTLACRSSEAAPSDDELGGAAGARPVASTTHDAGVPPQATGGRPADPADASAIPLPPLSGEVCALRVGARCDGAEDCAAGQLCCAQFHRATYSYTRIECSDTCDALDQYALCHPGSACREPSHVCRRSVIVPHDFVTVCADPAKVPTDTTSRAVEGEILCGSATCRAGAEQCCLRSRFDLASMVSTALAPYCAPLDAACDCDDEAPPGDASAEDGG